MTLCPNCSFFCFERGNGLGNMLEPPLFGIIPNGRKVLKCVYTLSNMWQGECVLWNEAMVKTYLPTQQCHILHSLFSIFICNPWKGWVAWIQNVGDVTQKISNYTCVTEYTHNTGRWKNWTTIEKCKTQKTEIIWGSYSNDLCLSLTTRTNILFQIYHTLNTTISLHSSLQAMGQLVTQIYHTRLNMRG